MFLSKVRTATAMLLVGGMIGTGAEPQDRPNGTTVTGRVVSEPGGQGITDVVVTLWNGSNGQRQTSRTDDAGSYSFTAVEPGDHYKVWIQERPKTEAGVWSEGVVVGRVEDRPVRADDLFLKLPQSLSGTVTDVDSGKPVPGVTINFSTADKNRQEIRTDGEGHYCLFVTPRQVELHCSGTDERFYPSSQGDEKVTVLTGKNITEIDFKIKSAPKFTGLVVFPDGRPAKDLEMTVEVHWSGNGGRSGAIDAHGTGRHLRFKTDDEGRFLGYARRPWDRGEDWQETLTFKAIARLPDGTMGGVGHATTDSKDFRVDPLKVVLAKTAGLKVRVVNPDGEPLTNAEVTASDIQPSFNTQWGGPVSHLGEGRYQMTGLVPGLDYYLAIQSPGYQPGSITKKLVLELNETRDVGEIRLDWWGTKAVPGLLKKLQSADMYDREGAAHLLGRLGADAAGAVPALVETLKNDPRNSVRFNMAAALGKIGPAAKAAVPDLIRALQEDTGGGVQREAATALGLIGDLSALPSLRDAVKSSQRDVQRAAAEAIERLEKASKTGSPGGLTTSDDRGPA
jgi:hypothetical protein